MCLWEKILQARTPEALDAADWQRLRHMAAQITSFQTEKGADTATKARRLLRVIGYTSFDDLERSHESGFRDVHFVLAVQKACIEHGEPIDRVKARGIVDYEGKCVRGHQVRKRYYEALRRMGLTSDGLEALFEAYEGCTLREYKASVLVKKKYLKRLDKDK